MDWLFLTLFDLNQNHNIRIGEHTANGFIPSDDMDLLIHTNVVSSHHLSSFHFRDFQIKRCRLCSIRCSNLMRIITSSSSSAQVNTFDVHYQGSFGYEVQFCPYYITSMCGIYHTGLLQYSKSNHLGSVSEFLTRNSENGTFNHCNNDAARSFIA